MRKKAFILATLANLCLIVIATASYFSSSHKAEAASSTQKEKNELNELIILYTGDSQATLSPCHCVSEPYGGLARRATAIAQIRQKAGQVLLLDAGGAFAGGIYDDHTNGQELDKRRTQVALEAMKIMGYDAIAVGDEELNFGKDFLLKLKAQNGVQPLSANLIEAKTGRTLVQPYMVKQVNSIKVGILSLTTPEAVSGDINLLNEGLRIADPIQAAKKYIADLKTKTDVVVVLSHLGEEMSTHLAHQVAGIDLIINSHRRASSDPSDSSEVWRRVKDTLMLHANFQAKKLGMVSLKVKSGKARKVVKAFTTQEIALSARVKDEAVISRLVSNFQREVAHSANRNELKVKFDLYVMGNCPYAYEAERVIYKVLKEFNGLIDFHLYFIVHQDKNGKLNSLRGEEEIFEDKIQASIFAQLPPKFWDYIFWKLESVTGTPWQEGARKAQVDPKLVESYIRNGKAESILNRDLIRVQSLRIEASPTIYINNQRYLGRVSEIELAKAVCAKLPKGTSAAPCKKLPECVSDIDCKKKGFVGICEKAGTAQARCAHLKDVKLDFTVISDKHAFFSNEAAIIDSTLLLFPNAQIRRLDANSIAGKRIIEKYAISRLPAYIFGDSLIKAYNFPKVKSQIRRVGGEYLLAPDAVGANIYSSRTPIPKQLELFVSPFSERANRVLLDVLKLFESLKSSKQGVKFQVRYLVYKDAHGDLVGTGGLAEAEEAARQAVILRKYPDRYQTYVATRFQALGSSYWEEAAKKANLDISTIKSLARGDLGLKLLQEDAKVVEELHLSPEFVFLINNREVATLQSPDEFRQLLERLTGITKSDKIIHSYD